MTHHVQGIIQAWQASCAAQSSSRPFRDMKEPPNALVLAVNLQALPLKDLTAFVETASEDEIKAHKGLRSSFVIAEVLFAGFTFIAKGDDPKNKQQGAGSIERLGVFDGEDKTSMLFYTWKGEQNKKAGAYIKTKRFDECASISQGMVVSATMWANKQVGNAKRGVSVEDVGLFDLCLVQLGIRSIASNASEAGMMLEVKGIVPLAQHTLSSCSVVPSGWMPTSIQESADFRRRFIEGELISEPNRKHLKQDLIKGNCSSTMHLLAVTPQPAHGAISVGADGKIRFFQQQPIGDLVASTIELAFDSKLHHPTGMPCAGACFGALLRGVTQGTLSGWPSC